jgi:hypothetical protein
MHTEQEYTWFFIHNNKGLIQFTGSKGLVNPMPEHPDKNPIKVKASDLYTAAQELEHH